MSSVYALFRVPSETTSNVDKPKALVTNGARGIGLGPNEHCSSWLFCASPESGFFRSALISASFVSWRRRIYEEYEFA